MVNAPEPHKIRLVSTGRGGAANFKKATKAARNDNNNPRQAPTASQAISDLDNELTRIATKASLGGRFAMGRGGAGNMLPSGQAPVSCNTLETVASRPRIAVSVGRGGAGNFKDAKSGRSISVSSSGGRPADQVDFARNRTMSNVRTDRPTWASSVRRIDAGLHENAIDDEDDGEDGGQLGRRSTNLSTRSAPNLGSFFGRMRRRRLSSFGPVGE